MSSAEAAAPQDDRPSVFLSYASEDRPAVRKLRDALQAAGVDAWYDENELTGGDAWDVKIRRQIRECTYFMPVISARASARLEGYFRREWRFALERMLDMADDVVFLLPIVIDDSQETTARVPEKFLTVQWMRVPDGNATKAFNELARRLAAGGAQRLHHAPTSRPGENSGGTRPPQYLPPLDSGPPAGVGAKLKYFWKKLPRWARIVGVIALVIALLDSCSGCGNRDRGNPAPKKSGRTAPKDQSVQAGIDAAQQVAAALRDVGTAAAANAKRQADLVVLSAPAKGRANGVLRDLYGKLVTASGVKSKFNVVALQDGETPAARALTENARFALLSELAEGADGRAVVRVTLVRAADGGAAWTADYGDDVAPAVISAQAYAQILPLLLKKE